MRAGCTGAQGALEVIAFPLRLLAATFIYSLILTGVSAQGNTAASRSIASGGTQAVTSVQVEGELEILHSDFNDGSSQYHYSLKKADGSRVPLKFVDRHPTHLLTGDHVRVSGQMAGGSLVLYSAAASKTTQTPAPPPASSIPLPNTFGVQSTAVILVNFQDNPVQPFTTGDAYNAVFGTANNFIVENSYGQTSLTGDVLGWYTIPVSSTTCDLSQIASASQNAAIAAGANLSAYVRYIYAFPQNIACGFAGSSYVGGNPSQSWINGVMSAHTVDHELGHAFGLWHSHLLDCGSTETICSAGTVVEYGDSMDVMGSVQSPSPDYNAFQKERLGWLNYGTSPAIQTVSSSGTYTLNTYELSGTGPNALKILKSTDPTTGAKTWYYIEARQALGFDAFLVGSAYYTQNETAGVLLHVGTDGNGNTGELLDMTPTTPSTLGWWDMSLTVGQSFQDSSTGVTVTTTAVNSAGATVQVTLSGSGGSSCTSANPTVTVSPSQSQPVLPGTAVNFIATVTDNDSSSCASTTFSLGSVLPSSWTGTWSASALPLSPGKTASATLTVTSPAGTVDGPYNVGVNATNASLTSYSGYAAGSYIVSTAPLTIALTTNQASYLPGQTVGIGVSLLYGSVPDVGASVAVTVTGPNGKATTLSGTTGSNGVALLTYKLSARALAGTYQVQFGAAPASKAPGGRTAAAVAVATSGPSTTFTVQ